MINGRVSFWHDEVPTPRPPLDGHRRADVAIVGAGYTGLWTAYYLKRARPDLEIVLLEARFAGYGASGRNGGWLTNTITGGRDRYLRSHGRPAVARFQVLMNQAVDEVISVAAAEGIDAAATKGGELTIARNPAQLARLRQLAEDEARWPEGGTRLLDADQTRARVEVAGALGALHHPHGARIQPARLVRGLAAAVERLGVRIYESTAVRSIAPHRARTAHGDVTARYVVRATEGFTATLPGLRRLWLPLNSSMVVTEPLPPTAWAAIGWGRRELVADLAHVYMYAQRTADDRIALGGRGVPYRYGSRTDTDGRADPRTVTGLHDLLTDMFPAARSARIEHAWSGVLGVPRDWAATVGLDAETGLAWAGGYVGTGVAATNLAARTLRDLLLGEDSDLTRLPWVDRRARSWEPEPLRWLGVRGVYAAYRAADRVEARGRPTTAALARLADTVAGR